jgi:hypothetical protein
MCPCSGTQLRCTAHLLGAMPASEESTGVNRMEAWTKKAARVAVVNASPAI